MINDIRANDQRCETLDFTSNIASQSKKGELKSPSNRSGVTTEHSVQQNSVSAAKDPSDLDTPTFALDNGDVDIDACIQQLYKFEAAFKATYRDVEKSFRNQEQREYRKEASDIRKFASIGCALQIVGGVAEIGGGLYGVHKLSSEEGFLKKDPSKVDVPEMFKSSIDADNAKVAQANSELKNAPKEQIPVAQSHLAQAKMERDKDTFQAVNLLSNLHVQKMQAILQAAQGVAGLCNSSGDLTSKLGQSQSTEDDAKAKQKGYINQDATQGRENAQQRFSTMFSTIQEILQNLYETNAKIFQ